MVEDSVKISNDKIELEPLNKEIIHCHEKITTSGWSVIWGFLIG